MLVEILDIKNSLLLSLSKIHKFNSTKEYKDWKSGDKIAAAGIGALLATTLGVKALKTRPYCCWFVITKKILDNNIFTIYLVR